MSELPLHRATTGSDREALAAVVEAHQGPIYGYLRARLLQVSDAEDLTQEVFLRFHAAQARFDDGQMLRPWLIGIARNLLREHLRRMKRRKEVEWTELCLELEELVHSPHDDYDAVQQRLPACLESLGPSARQAIDLRYAAKMRLAEIGERLRRSEGAIKLLMFRARQVLRLCLEQKSSPDPESTP